MMGHQDSGERGIVSRSGWCAHRLSGSFAPSTECQAGHTSIPVDGDLSVVIY